MDTTETTGQHHDTTTLTLRNLSVSSSVVNLIVQHEYTSRRIFRYIGWRETEASSLLGNDSEENKR